MFQRFALKINRLSGKTQLSLLCLCFFFASCLCFCAGTTNSRTTIETIGNKIASYTLENSTTGFVSAQVTPRNADAVKKMPNTSNEYLYWRYMFRDSNFSFLATANGGKKHQCLYSEIEKDENISFLYSEVNSNKAFDEYFKHEVYDIKLMFRGRNEAVGGARSFFAISKTTADLLLEKRGQNREENGFSRSQYEELLGSNTNILIDSELYPFTISNVYFEEGDFFENVSKNFGEFVIGYPYFYECLERESTYIFNCYEYQNTYKIKRMRQYFNDEDFACDISKYSLKKTENQYETLSLKGVLDEHIGNNAVSTILTLANSFLFSVSLLFFWYSKQSHRFKRVLVIGLFLILPYAVLALINIFYQTPLFFSYYSLILFTVEFLCFLALLGAILLKERGEVIRKLL